MTAILPRAVVIAAAVAGLVLRIWVLRSPLGEPNSDDAVVGLMALRSIDGEHFRFYWGQPYGGAFEPELTALFFRVFPRDGWTLRLVPVALHGFAAYLLTRVARRALDPRVATLAGLLWWIAPAAGVLWSVHAGGYYGALVVIGLAIALVALRIVEQPSRRDALLLGVLVGLGVWTSPQIAVLAVPPLVWLAWHCRTSWRQVPLLIVPTIIVLLPWFAYQLDHDWASVRTPPAVQHLSYLDRIGVWFESIPSLFGMVRPADGRWLFFGAPIAFAVALAATAMGFVRRRPRPFFVTAAVVASSFLFALSPYATTPDVVRYLYPLVPVVALMIAAAVGSTRAAVAVVALALITTTVAIVQTAADTDRDPRWWYELAPRDLDPLIAGLDGRGIDRLWAEYWIGYRLTFATEERIIAAPIEQIRYEPYEDMVAASGRAVYVYPACDADYLREILDAHELASRETTYGEFTVFELTERGPDPDAPDPDAPDPDALGLRRPLFRTPACFT